MSENVNNQYDFFKLVNLDADGNLGVTISGGTGGGATDLTIGNKTSTTLDVESSTGTNATVPSVTTSEAGLSSAADKTKLDGIEAGADVTDATNVNAAGALMESEVTNVAEVKAFDSTDYATAAQGTTADNALPKAGGAMTGPITTNSTFDGRDVATDGTKLDTIETNADVTDTASVSTAGALMRTGGTMTGDLDLNDNVKIKLGTGDDLEIYHDGASSFIEDAGQGNLILLSDGPDGIILGKGDAASFERMVRALPDAEVELYHNNNLRLITRNAGVDITGNIVVTGLVDGRDVAVDGNKLDGIEAGATTDQTLSKTFTLQEPVSGDDITIFRTDVPITIQEVIAVSVGTTPNTTYSISYSTDRSAAGTTLVASTTTSGTVNGDVATITNTSIPANSFIWFECSASSGTGVYLSIDIRFTED